MWIKASTQLSENVYQVTTPASSHMAVVGDVLALVDCGLACTAERLIEELAPSVSADLPLRYLLLTHAHFDHVGGLPALRRFAPDMQVIGSPLCEEVFADDEKMKAIYEQNRRCAEAMQKPFDEDFSTWRAGFRLDRIMGEGDLVDLGNDVTIKIIACPGHSPEGLAYFVNPDGALAAAESVGGYHGREKLAPCFVTSIDEYNTSIDKFLDLDVKVVSLPHNGALTGQLAKKFVLDSRQQAAIFCAAVKERLEAGAIKEEIYFDLLGEWTVAGIAPEGPFIQGQQENLRRMIELAIAE